MLNMSFVTDVFKKKPAGRMLLILPDCFLKISRTPFNSLMSDGNKR